MEWGEAFQTVGGTWQKSSGSLWVVEEEEEYGETAWLEEVGGCKVIGLCMRGEGEEV